jgi:deoxycytidylate deaminase
MSIEQVSGHEKKAQQSPHGYEYPFLPANIEIAYVDANNPFMIRAKEWARIHSLDKQQPNTSVIVKGGVELGIGANGSDFHSRPENIAQYGEKGCRRVFLKAPSGTMYEECEGCHPKNHGEARALLDAQEKGVDVTGAEIYMWGHWWCCESCCAAMEAVGIRKVYVTENADRDFNQKDPGNILGKQFI